MNLRDATEIMSRLLHQFIENKQGFRTLVLQEGERFFKKRFAEDARALIPRIKAEHLLPCEKVGIRAQLVDIEKRELVMDFLVENAHRSTHILNAVSPAFTSAFSFARFVIDGMEADQFSNS
jgi:hypothetical protein